MNYVLKFTFVVVGIFIAPAVIFSETLLNFCGLHEYLAVSSVIEVRIFSLSLILICVGFTFIILYYYTGVKQNTAGNILSLTGSDRIKVLRALVSGIKYDRVFSLNQTLITINISTKG